MKRALLFPLLLLLLATITRAAERKPNLIFVLADDLGYGELGAYGQKTIRTPRLDRMAAEGLRFTQFYAGSTVCAPSRSVLMTGQHLGHTRVRGNAAGRGQMLRDEDVTLAEVLKKSGYATAHIGKWGLGELGSDGAPTRQGFDYFFGYLNQLHAHNYWPEFLIRNDERVPLRNKVARTGKPADATGAGTATEKVDYAPDLLIADALRWVEEHKDQPFFLYFSPIQPHANNEAMKATGDGNEVRELGDYATKPWSQPDKGHAAMVTQLDADVGKLLDHLQKLGLDENTLVVFSSDNGATREGGHDLERFAPSGPLRGIKRDLYEGGIRVPAIARWPRKVSAGSVSDHVAYFGDVMATFAEVGGGELPPARDSISFVPALLGKADQQRKHEFLYWEFHERGFNQAALLDGRWKAVRKKRRAAPLELYDLASDIGETRNVAAAQPEIAAKLAAYLQNARTESEDWPIKDAAANAQPNILWLIAEDMGPALGCYGQQQVSTPNLDRLAAEGVRFNRAYTTAPVCSPSRSAFMTGMYQTTIGAHNHRSHRDDQFRLPAGVKLLHEWLRDASYFTANVIELPPEFGFKGTGKTDWNFSAPSKGGFDSRRWADLAGSQPFFAQINFQETHRAFHAPKHADPTKIELPPYYPDHPIVRADYAAYLDAATELDRKIGLVLAQLERDGLAENTIVVFMGDNGEAHIRGKQFCYEEGLRVPLIMRWPEGMPPPTGLTRGSVDERLVEAIDLAPTMLAFARAPVPAKMQGRVLFGKNAAPPREYAFGARDRCDETVFRLRTVRDTRYRYIRNFTPDRPFLQPNNYKAKQYPLWTLLPQLQAEGKLTPEQAALCAPTMPEEELYDLETDPHEVRNLAASREHAEVLGRLRGVLKKWIIETDDQGRNLEPEELVKRQGRTTANTHLHSGYTMDGPRITTGLRPALQR